MKTALIFASLVVLLPLSIHAQEDIASDHLLASVGFYDTNLPSPSEDDFQASMAAEWVSQPSALTASYEQDDKRTYLNSLADFQRDALSLTVSVVSDVAPIKSSHAISELDYSKLYQVVDYDYFLKDGGLRLQLFR